MIVKSSNEEEAEAVIVEAVAILRCYKISEIGFKREGG